MLKLWNAMLTEPIAFILGIAVTAVIIGLIDSLVNTPEK
jgi:uncharacterized membrane protein (DUF106 family)